MTLEPLFSLGFPLVAPFWFLIVALPFWGVTERVMRSPWVILGPALLYVVLALPNVGAVLSAFDPPTVESVSSLLSTPLGTTLAWQHFLAFDLFVARWAYLDSRANRIPWLLVSPLLYLVLMLGPVGFVAYLLLRTLTLGWRRGSFRSMVYSPADPVRGDAA